MARTHANLSHGRSALTPTARRELHDRGRLSARGRSIRGAWLRAPPTPAIMTRSDAPPPPKAPLDRAALSEVVRLALWAGQLLMENGAESERIEQTVRSCSTSLGCDSSSVVVLYNAILVTHVSGNDFRTKVRRARPRTVNMSLIEAISHLSHRVSEGLVDRAQFRVALQEIEATPRPYRAWLPAVAVGLGCAAFSRLFGGDWAAFAMTLVSSTGAQWIRQKMVTRGMNSLVATAISAAASASLVGGIHTLWGASRALTAALAACSLMLVPGVPAINATEDLIKGHISVGIARASEAGLIILMATLGLILGTSFVLSRP